MDNSQNLTTQNSSYRLMKQSLSLPNIVPPAIEASEFLKTYDKLQKTHSRVMRAMRLEHLKRVRIKGVEEETFNHAIRHLEDIATQPRFMREYVELLPLTPVTGFVEANQGQYFVVTLSGLQSPLCLDVRKDKGNVACYFSYRSLKPGPKLYDFMFKGRTFRIHSKFSFFKDKKAYLCAIPDTDTSITICIGFGPQHANDDGGVLAPRGSMQFSFDDLSDEVPQEFVGRGILVLDHSRIGREAKDNSDELSRSVDFIEINKNVRVKTRSRLRAINEQRHAQVKERRAAHESEVLHKAMNAVERHDTRKTALAQAQFITKVLQRKARFEAMWLSLIYFSQFSQQLHTRFVATKIAAVKNLRRSIACQKFQRMYRAKFSKDFGIEVRMLALAKNHIRLGLKMTQYFCAFSHRRTCLVYLRESYKQSHVAIALTHTFSRIVMIQRNWREKHMLEQYYFRYLSDMWDRIVGNEEERMRRKRGKKGRRFIHIDESQKMDGVLQGLLGAKVRLKEYYARTGERSALLGLFLPKYAALRKVVLRKAKEAQKPPQ